MQSDESRIVQVLLKNALELAGSTIALGKILKVSRISIWSWQHDEYLPRGKNLLGLINYIEAEKLKREDAKNTEAA
jgi:hypothetical protein